MFKKLRSIFISNSFPPKINYPVYYYIKNTILANFPIISRIVRSFCYHIRYFRDRFCDLRVNERIIEIPIIIQAIKIDKAEILDVGCSESQLTLYLASIGHKVTALDLHGYEFRHENISVVKGDIRNINLPNNKYDYIIFLSVIEHVGLGAYGETGSLAGDKIAINNVKKALKKGGRIIVSVPYGKKGVNEKQRVYDESSIIDLFSDFTVEKSFYYIGLKQKQWIEVNKESLENIDSLDYTQGAGIFILKDTYE